MRSFRCICGLLLVAALTGGNTYAQNAKTAPAAGGDENGSAVRTTMRNVEYHLTDRIIVHIIALNGELKPKPGQIPIFDDKNSFGVEVDSANITLSMTALTNDLNDFVFAKPDAPIKHLTASTDGWLEVMITGARSLRTS